MNEKIRVLLAEDDRIIRYMLAEGLQQAGYTVECAENGEQAWSQFLKTPADIALLDIRMPILDGLGLARRLREFSDIPLVFLTAYGDSDLVTEAAQLGATSYLLKPVHIQQVIPSIQLALAQHASMRKLKDRNKNLETALLSDQQIAMAVGILRERLKVDEKNAFEFMRTKARNQRRKMLEIAGEILNTQG